MKAYKTSVIVFLLSICIIAIALGYAGSKSIPEENITFVAIEANPAGMSIPQYLITEEVGNILLEINNTYPDSVLFGSEQVTLIGSSPVNSFKNSINENNIDFNWTAVGSFYELETSVVTADRLEVLLNADNETASYYRGLLNNGSQENSSEYGFYAEGNGSLVYIVAIDTDLSPQQNGAQQNGTVATVTIISAENNNE